MSDHYVIVGDAESNTVRFADSIVKLVDLAKQNPRVATIVALGLGVLSVTTFVAVWYYSSLITFLNHLQA
jgi:hypothetical protein